MEYIFDLTYPADMPPGFTNRQCCGSTPVDLLQGVWSAELSGVDEWYGTFGQTQYEEIVNQVNDFSCEVNLNRSFQYTGYTAQFVRVATFADATYFDLEFNQNFNVLGWTLKFVNGSDAVVHSFDMPNTVMQSLHFVSTDFDFASVAKVVLKRDEEVYATSAPRIFAVEFTVDTDSEDWQYHSIM